MGFIRPKFGTFAALGFTAVLACTSQGLAQETVRIQGIENMAGLDRYAVNGVGQDSIAMLWGDMLVSSDHNGNYTPGAITEWLWADDGLSVTLNVRDGVVFSNGEPMTSEDIAFTILRLKSPELPNARAWDVVDTVETPDAHTAVVRFSAPMPIFLNLASRTPVLDASAFAANPAGYFAAPIGTGPYAVVEFDGPTGTVVLEKKDDWWGWTDDNQTNVSTIQYRYSPAEQSRISALLAGEVDIIQKVPVNEAKRLEDEGFSIESYIENSQVYIGLRVKEGSAFADPLLRQALSKSIDRQAIVTSLLGGGRVSTWPSMPGSVGYRENPGYDYDPQGAAALVQQSGYDGRALNFYLPNGLFAQGKEIGETIQAMAAGSGINLAVQTLETATFQEYISAGNYDLYMNSFTMVNADSFTQITSLIGRDRFNTGYANPEVTRLAGEAGVAVDLEKRGEITAEAYRHIMNDFAPGLYLYEPMGVTASASGVSGFVSFPDMVADFRFMHKD